MKRVTHWLASLPILLSATTLAYATPEDTCKALMETRGHLVTMLDSSDKATQDDLKAKVHAASARVDEALAAMASGPSAAKASEFAGVWNEFKKTREAEIIPAIYAGKKDEAKAVATSVQAERMKKMKGLMGCP